MAVSTSDTTAAAERVRLAAIRKMAPVDRVWHAFALSESVRELALSRLRTVHPGRSDCELVELLLGVSLIPKRSSHA